MIEKQIRTVVILAFIMILSTISLQAQARTVTFDEVYLKTLNEYASTEPNLALHVADSLLEHSVTPILKLRSLMLKAYIYQENNDAKNAIKSAEQAEQLAFNIKNHDWSLRTLGFIASQYHSLDFIEESEVYLQKAEEQLGYIKDQDTFNTYFNTILKGKALNAFAQNKFLESLAYLKQSDSLIDLLSNFRNKDYFKTTLEIIKGKNYYELSEYELSKEAYLKSKIFMDRYGNESDPLYSQIYTGLGMLAAIKGKDRSEIWSFYEQAIRLTELYPDSKSKIFLYKSLLPYFAKEEDWSNYRKYTRKLMEEQVVVNDCKNEVMTVVFNKLATNDAVLSKPNRNYRGVIVILIGVLIGVVVYFKRKKKVYREEHSDTVSTLKRQIREKEDDIVVAIEEPVEPKSSQKNDKKSKPIVISEETKARIWAKIEEFEKEDVYLEPNMTLSYLAAYCDTNNKYVSIVLKEQTEKDFSTYINELRVHYIIKKLQEDKVYRSYKISYLAKIAGFSSHSVFSSVFKQISGFSPSEFISLLSEEE